MRRKRLKERGITLISLVVTIIILLILAAITINLTIGQGGLIQRAKNARIIQQNAEVNESQQLNELEKNMESVVEKTEKNTKKYGTKIADTSNYPTINISGLKYADIDNDGVADGIIVADLARRNNDIRNTYKGGNPWGDIWGSFSYRKQIRDLKEYDIPNDDNYTYTFGNSNVSGKLVKCTNSNGNPRFYIIALADIDNNTHYWYKNANKKLDNFYSITYNDFGKGKSFTDYNIKKWNDSKYGEQIESKDSQNADVWGIIQDEVKDGWFVPSRAEWSAFASYLNTSRRSTNSNYYENYGLSSSYWSSAQYYRSYAYGIYFAGGCIAFSNVGSLTTDTGKFYGLNVRLASTF